MSNWNAKSKIRKWLLGDNRFITEATPLSQIKELLASLHPVQTEHSLLRLGADGDGGYLIPDDLAGIAACYSPGVGATSVFEQDCAKLGMEVYLADASVSNPPENDVRFNFTKKYIGALSNDTFMTLTEWVQESSRENGDLLLQIDIEGYEYEAILATDESTMNRFRIIAAEFHLLDMLWSRPFYLVASRAIEKLLATHVCVHIHPNNCCHVERRNGISIPRAMEFTFLRRDRYSHASPASVFPHPLDCDNTSKSHLVLPDCWFVK